MQVEYHDVSGHKRYLDLGFEKAVSRDEEIAEQFEQLMRRVYLLIITTGLYLRLKITRRTFRI